MLIQLMLIQTIAWKTESLKILYVVILYGFELNASFANDNEAYAHNCKCPQKLSILQTSLKILMENEIPWYSILFPESVFVYHYFEIDVLLRFPETWEHTI